MFRVIPPRVDVLDPIAQQLSKPFPFGQQLEIEARTRGCSPVTFYECLRLLLRDYPEDNHSYDADELVAWFDNGVRSRTHGATGHVAWSFKEAQWQTSEGQEQFYPHAWRFSASLEKESVPSALGSSSHARRRSHWHFTLPLCSMDLYRWLDGDPRHQFMVEIDVTVSSSSPSTPSTAWWPAFKYCLGKYVHPHQFLLCTIPPVQTIDQWFLPELRTQLRSSSFPHFPRGRPRTESDFRSQLTRDFVVSLKLDGQNEVFVVGFENGVLALVVNHVHPIEVRYINAPIACDSGRRVRFVLQGEWMRDIGEVHVFDALLHDGEPLLFRPHRERVGRLSDPVAWQGVLAWVHEKSLGSLRLKLKPWAATVAELNFVLSSSDSAPPPSDGHIWMDGSKSYADTVVFKDKPSHELTVDVTVERSPDDANSRLCFSGGRRGAPRVLVDRWQPWPQLAVEWARSHRPVLPDMYWADQVDGCVVECRLVLGSHFPDMLVFPFRLVPVRLRPGKAAGNAPFVIEQTLESMVGRRVSVSGVGHSSVHECRARHNAVKTRLLSDTWVVGPNVLDIGFGKGGDLHKYAHLTVKPELGTIFAVEPNQRFWQEAQQRFHRQTFPFSLLPVQIGVLCQRLNLDMLPGVPCHTVVMMFSLAYMWDSVQSVAHWLQVLDRVQGKRLILTFMDQYELADLTVAHRSSRLAFKRSGGGSQVVEFFWPQVRDALDKDDRVYGHPVLVSILPSQTAERVVEWMVHQPTLMRLLHERGWRLQLNELFSSMSASSDPWDRLFRAQVWTR